MGEANRGFSRRKVLAILREFYDPGLSLHINGIYIRVRGMGEEGFSKKKRERERGNWDAAAIPTFHVRVVY